MAQRVDISLVDDLDGGEATETVAFGLDGTAYEIDVAEKNAAKIRKALAPFIESARKVNYRSNVTTRRKAAATGPAAADIRAWAVEQGYEVPEKGRIPADIRDAHTAAH